jgi:hypothetical protein
LHSAVVGKDDMSIRIVHLMNCKHSIPERSIGFLMHGNLITAEGVFFHVKSRTVLFTDLIQQLADRANRKTMNWKTTDLRSDAPEPCR